MERLKSIKDLGLLKEKLASRIALREDSYIPNKQFEPSRGMEILICGGTACKSSSSEETHKRLEQCLKSHSLEKGVRLISTGCFGFCEQGAIIKIIPDNTFYVHVTPDDVEEIITEHIINGHKVERLLYVNPENNKIISDSKHMDFYKKQMRIALRNCGFLDPLSLQEAIARDAYSALSLCLEKLNPQEVIDIIKESGLRGRGGGGYPTGIKWEIAKNNESSQKYVVCNADEGDPGAFMDRSILEGDPHSVLEAMAICGYSIGANKGLIYVRAEYPLVVKTLKIAIKQALDISLLGDNILGTGFNFDIEIRYGAGAFVCGEETALIHSMEGERGEPSIKPPYPAQTGFMGRPTNVNNVETFANIPIIILKGASWFNKIGTKGSKGTKVFALAGKIRNVGLVEVPMGTSLREIIFDIGGGIRNGKKFKSVLTGGPSGGCLNESDLDTPIDFDNLLAIGSMMGSGGMIVMDEDDCMVSIAHFYLGFAVEESCGKCSPCRIGNKRLYEILDKICRGEACIEDLDVLRNLCHVVKDTSLCGLGQSSPNPILSTLDNFYEEYRSHIEDKKCISGKCKMKASSNLIRK